MDKSCSRAIFITNIENWDSINLPVKWYVVGTCFTFPDGHTSLANEEGKQTLLVTHSWEIAELTFQLMGRKFDVQIKPIP